MIDVVKRVDVLSIYSDLQNIAKIHTGVIPPKGVSMKRES